MQSPNELRAISSHLSAEDQPEVNDGSSDAPALRNSVPRLSPLGSEPSPGVDSGWTAVAKIVHDVDKSKIKDYKEDIDTILVFAGLFSAVMTAFLIESYQNLRQDPQDVMVTLLQQLVLQTQSYSLTSGYLNSTAAPAPSLPSFQPSVNAIRVNVLWFASLILSLISASFGILVKQWLREYLAGERTSPQARLRIRHFRHPGLSDWKVFEIAALLPMLLQLALALFFVGLCFFTADVHNSVRNTTLPLVAGWAFLFFAASLSPALSPRCPYKTTLLKPLNRCLRRQLYKTVSRVRHMMNLSWEVEAQSENKWSYRLFENDEGHVAETQDKDMDILVSVDAIQADERLVDVMWDALQQARVDAAQAVDFLFSIITHRLGQEHVVQQFDSTFLDLRRLSKSTLTSLFEMAADLILRQLQQHQVREIPHDIFKQSPWIKDCLYLLFSEGYSESLLTPRADAVLLEFIAIGNRPVICDLIKSRTAFWLMRRLRANLVRFRTVELLHFVHNLWQTTLCHKHNLTTPPPHSTILDILHDHHHEILPDDLGDTVDILVSCVTNQGWDDGFDRLHSQNSVVLECAIKYYTSPVVNKTNIINLVRMIITSPDNVHFYRYLSSNGGSSNPDVEEASCELLIETFLASKPEDRMVILENFSLMFSSFWQKGPRSHYDVWMDPLMMCYVQLRFFDSMQKRGVPSREYLESYLPHFWSLFVDGWQQHGHMSWRADDVQFAKKCLTLIDTLDPCPVGTEGDDTQAFATWARSFVHEDSPFPDELIKLLVQFPRSVVEHTYSARARRIRLLEQQTDVGPSRPSSQHQSSRSSQERHADNSENTTEILSEDHQIADGRQENDSTDAQSLYSAQEGNGLDTSL